MLHRTSYNNHLLLDEKFDEDNAMKIIVVARGESELDNGTWSIEETNSEVLKRPLEVLADLCHLSIPRNHLPYTKKNNRTSNSNLNKLSIYNYEP